MLSNQTTGLCSARNGLAKWWASQRWALHTMQTSMPHLWVSSTRFTSDPASGDKELAVAFMPLLCSSFVTGH